MQGTPRLALLRDGTAVGCFSLLHHETHVVVVEPNGHAYSYIGPSGRPSRHLTPTLLASHRDLVRSVIEFRNRYAGCVPDHDLQRPYVHAAVGDIGGYERQVRSRSSEAVTVCWPQFSTFSATALWNEKDRVFEVQSLDSSASVRLDASGNVAHARFLVKLARESSQGDECTSHEFSWVEQTFPSVSPPQCFVAAVQLLSEACNARHSGQDQFSVERDGVSSFLLPVNSARGARPSFRPLSDEPDKARRVSKFGLYGPEDTVSVEAISRWIKGMSRSLDLIVVVERADSTDYLVSTRDSSSTVLMLRHGHRSELKPSLVDCDRGFFRAFGPGGEVSHQFTSETIPLTLELFDQDSDRTRTLLLRASELCQAASVRPRTSLGHQNHHSPVTLLEDVSNDVGRFRAYSDGRVRVIFADRTILQVTSGQFAEEYSFTYNDGSTGRCTSDSVSTAQAGYVNAAMDFAQWAFATPEQRFRRHQLQQEQQELVARELHRIAVRTELNAEKSKKTESSDSIDGTSAHTFDRAIPIDGQDGMQDTVGRLLQETQRHIAHVQALLRDEVSQRN